MKNLWKVNKPAAGDLSFDLKKGILRKKPFSSSLPPFNLAPSPVAEFDLQICFL